MYAAVTYLLHELGETYPLYRSSLRGKDALVLSASHANEWTIDQVCSWVGMQPFRSYRANFRDHMINGAMLLTLTDAELEAADISNLLHRKNILFAIEDLRSKSVHSIVRPQLSISTSSSGKRCQTNTF